MSGKVKLEKGLVNKIIEESKCLEDIGINSVWLNSLR